MTGKPPMQSLVAQLAREGRSWSVGRRVGVLVAAGTAAAIACSFPSALRVNGQGSVGLVLEQWLVLSAVTTPLAIATIAVFGRAREGLRLWLGARADGLVLAALWWSAIELALLSLFGAVLRKTTHQHALAGVTFAAFSMGSGAIALIFALRATASLTRGGQDARRYGLGIAGAFAGLAVLLVGVGTSRAVELHTATALLDVFTFLVATVASARWIRRWQFGVRVGPIVGALLIVVGLTTLRFDPQVQKDLAETAPLFAFVSGFFSA